MEDKSLRELLSRLRAFELALLCEEYLSKNERGWLYTSSLYQTERYGVDSPFKMPGYIRLDSLKSQNRFYLVDALIRVRSEEIRLAAQKYIDGREAEDRYLKRLDSSTVVAQIVYVDKACAVCGCLRKLYGRIKGFLKGGK